MLVLIGLPLALAQAQEATGGLKEEPGIGGGGPMPALLLLDLAGLNQVLLNNGYGPLDNMVFLIGGGGADLTLLDHRSSSFEKAISNPPNVSLTRGFFAIEIYAGIDFALLDWLMLKVNFGYLWTFGGPWKQDGLPLPGPPQSLSAPLIQIMMAFGGREAPEETP